MSDHMPKSAEQGHVLVVEDEEMLRAAIARYLRAEGYAVVEASDGERATAALGQESFDAIFSDIMMPGLDGIGLLRYVRRHDLDVPVILATGAPAVESAVEAVKLGALEYLTKPVSLARIGEVVARAVALGRMARVKRAALESLDPSFHRAGDRAGLEATFERCLASMWMAFQPILRRDGTLLGHEALMRSRESALPHPGAVLDAAEKLGRLDDLGRHVRRLVATGVAESKDTVFVNLHARDLDDDDLLDAGGGLGAIAPRVVLEITERAALTDIARARARVEKLRALGYRRPRRRLRGPLVLHHARARRVQARHVARARRRSHAQAPQARRLDDLALPRPRHRGGRRRRGDRGRAPRAARRGLRSLPGLSPRAPRPAVPDADVAHS